MTQIFAHRGASGYAPENTLEAFALAMEQGADGIELDVQLTKDGEIVVIHDERIDRTSNCKGWVKDYTLKEIKEFTFNNHMEKYQGAKIPTLREVLELVKPSDMQVNIELKTGIIWYPEIEEKVVELVAELGMENRIIYSSFNHYSIQKIQILNDKAETAFLLEDVMLDVEEYAKKHGVQGIHPAGYHLRMADFMESYKASGLKIRVWTVNEEADMQECMEHGLTAIFTNYPDKALRVRAEIGRKEKLEEKN